MSRICPDILGKLRHEIDICCVIFFLFWEGGPLVALLVICLVCVYKFFSSITPSMVTSPTFHLQVPTSVCSYRVSQKRIGFRNVAEFSLWGLSAVKMRVFFGAEHIYTMTRRFVFTFANPHLSPYIPLNGHIVKGIPFS